MNNRGFTLLELIIALALTSLLALLIFGGLRMGGQAWEKVHQHGAEASDSVLIQQFMRNLLEQAALESVWDPNRNQVSSFQGSEHELVFLAPHPGRQGDRPLAWFMLQLDRNDPEHHQILLSSQPFERNEPLDWNLLYTTLQDPELSPPLLAFSAEELDLSYRRSEDDNWQRQWLKEPALPQLMLIQVSNTRHLGTWPPLVITSRSNRYAIKSTF